MPAKPSYAHRLSGAIANLEARSVPQIGRQNLEELLGISKTVAWRVMRACGSTLAPGGALLCDRLQLIERLKQLAGGEVIAKEAKRHKRVENHILEMQAFMRSKVSAEETNAVRRTRFQKLPPNITMTPRSLRIDFQDSGEFISAVGAVLFALQNDLEEMRHFIDSSF
jgi:hypothetical protein